MRAGNSTRLIIAALTIALVGAACSRTAETTTTTSSPTTTSSSTPTTSATTSSTSTTSTTSTLATGTVGDPAVLEAALDEASIGALAVFGVERDQIPTPDLTNADPLVALAEILKFDIWVFQNAPRRALVEVYTVDRSPSWEDLVLATDRIDDGRFRFADGEGLAVSVVDHATDQQRSMVPPGVLDDAPPESVVLFYVFSADPFDIVDLEGNVRSSNEGWTDTEVLAIVSKSGRGWLLFWEDVQ